jgi:hypothetical protein
MDDPGASGMTVWHAIQTKVPVCVTSLYLEIVIVHSLPSPLCAARLVIVCPLLVIRQGDHHSHQPASAACDVDSFLLFFSTTICFLVALLIITSITT